MKKKWLLRILIFLIVATAGFLWLSPYHRQLLFGPRIQGVPLVAWQEHFRDPDPHFVVDKSTWGKLRDWLRSKSELPNWETLAEADREFLCLSLIADVDPLVRRQVASGLAGVSTRTAADGLLLLFVDRDSRVRDQAARWLGNALALNRPFAAEITSKLTKVLQHADPARRQLAATTLNRGWPRSRELLDAITSMLRDADVAVRVENVKCLRQWERSRMATASVPELLRLLDDEDVHCRIEAAHAVWCVGKKSAEATATFARTLKHPNEQVRFEAVRRLELLRKDGQGAFAELTQAAFHDESPSVRRVATVCLGYCGQQAVPVILKSLQSSDPEFRKVAVRALGQIGPDAAAAAPLLVKLLEECQSEVVGALGSMQAKDAIAPLIASLNNPKCDLHRVIGTLGTYGADANAAVPQLRRILEERPGDLRTQAAVALAQIEDNIDRIVPILLQHLDSPEPRPWIPLAAVANRVGPKLKSILPELRRRLRDLQHPQRVEVIDFVAGIGPDAKQAIPELMALVKLDGTSDEATVSDAAVYALGVIQKAPDQVVPLLCDQLSSKNRHWHKRPIEALGKFGPAAHAAIPVLLPLLEDDDVDLYEASRAALAKIDPERFPVKKAP